MTHYIPLIFNNIEICNIDDIITMHVIFDINCLRIGCSAQQFNISGYFLFATFILVTFCSKFFDTSICLACTNTTNRTLMNLAHYTSNPRLISFEQFWSTFLGKLIIWKQLLITFESMCQLRILVSKDFHSCFKTSYTTLFCQFDDRFLISMAKYILSFHFHTIKYIMFHSFISSF